MLVEKSESLSLVGLDESAEWSRLRSGPGFEFCSAV